MPDLDGIGINLSAARTYYYWSGAWRQVGQGTANKSDDVLLPDAYVIVRHNVADSTTVTCNGAVWMAKLAVPLAVQAGNKQDNFVALVRPTNVSLNDSGLVSSGAFSPSPSPGARTDELLVFDDTVDMAGMARYAMEFCAKESCGKCTPCRIGSTRGVELMDRVLANVDRERNLQLVEELCDTLLHGSLCGLGGMTPFPVQSVLNHFPEDLKARAGKPKAA